MSRVAVSDRAYNFQKGAKVSMHIPVQKLSNEHCREETGSMTVESFRSKQVRGPYADYNETILTGTVNLSSDLIPFTRFGSNRQVITVGNLEFQLMSWERVSNQDVRLELSMIGRSYDISGNRA